MRDIISLSLNIFLIVPFNVFHTLQECNFLHKPLLDNSSFNPTKSTPCKPEANDLPYHQQLRLCRDNVLEGGGE